MESKTRNSRTPKDCSVYENCIEKKDEIIHMDQDFLHFLCVGCWGVYSNQGKYIVVKNKKGKVKQVIMNPEIIAGIGNIYASEALWLAKIHPEKNVAKLSEKELKSLYSAIQKVLALAVKLGGESFSDYRKVDGSKGDFDTERKVYKREDQKCYRCGAKINRIKFGGRSAFFCPNCQKI